MSELPAIEDPGLRIQDLAGSGVSPGETQDLPGSAPEPEPAPGSHWNAPKQPYAPSYADPPVTSFQTVVGGLGLDGDRPLPLREDAPPQPEAAPVTVVPPDDGLTAVFIPNAHYGGPGVVRMPEARAAGLIAQGLAVRGTSPPIGG